MSSEYLVLDEPRPTLPQASWSSGLTLRSLFFLSRPSPYAIWPASASHASRARRRDPQRGCAIFCCACRRLRNPGPEVALDELLPGAAGAFHRFRVRSGSVLQPEEDEQERELVPEMIGVVGVAFRHLAAERLVEEDVLVEDGGGVPFLHVMRLEEGHRRRGEADVERGQEKGLPFPGIARKPLPEFAGVAPAQPAARREIFQPVGSEEQVPLFLRGPSERQEKRPGQRFPGRLPLPARFFRRVPHGRTRYHGEYHL